MASLDTFGIVQPVPCRPGWPYNDIRLVSWVRLWGLATCGSHPFCDGRAARHRGFHQCCPCGAADFTLLHALAICPCTQALRETWAHRVGLAWAIPGVIANLASALWIFDLSDCRNSLGTMAAHILFVGHVCHLADSGVYGTQSLASLEDPHEVPSEPH